MSSFKLDRAVTRYAASRGARNGISLDLQPGEIVALVGPRGSGKTATMRAIAGVTKPVAGRITVDAADLESFAGQHKPVRVVEADRHSSGLRSRLIRSQVAPTLADRVQDAADQKPRVILLDQPLLGVEPKDRSRVLAEIARLRSVLGRAALVVTIREPAEALAVADRVVILRDGEAQQMGTPQQIYRMPANVYVAALVGSPTINLVEATMADGQLSFPGHTLPIPVQTGAATRDVIVGIRPDALGDAALVRAAGPSLVVTPTTVLKAGREKLVRFVVPAQQVLTSDVRAAVDYRRSIVRDESVFTASVSPHSKAKVGQPLELVASELHVFDAETGKRISFAAA